MVVNLNKDVTPFPKKVHLLLETAEQEGLADVVCWKPHGRAFIVLKPKDFAEKLLKRFFSMSKYASFQRQLNIYGFDRFLDGPDRGAYFHPLFLRGSPHATDHMVRRKIKGLSSKKMRSISSQPDFYAESRAQDQFFRSSLAKRTSSCSHTPAPAPAPTLSKMTSSPVSVVSALNDVVSADMMSIFQLNHQNYETSSLCIPSVFDLKKAPLKLPSEWIEPNEIPGLAEKASPSSAVSQDNLDPIPLDRLDEFSVSPHDKVLLKDLLPEHFDAIFQ